MSSVTQSVLPAAAAPAVDAFLAEVGAERSAQAMALLSEAVQCVLRDEPGATDPRAAAHAFGTARLLHELGVDHEAVAAALLHPWAAAARLDGAALARRYGPSLGRLLEGVLNMDVVPAATQAGAGDVGRRAGAENLRKMLIAMVDDVRVVLVRLAEQLQTLRQLKSAEPALQIAVAKETLELFAPLANRLGVWQLKWELEDLSLRYLEPEAYRRIAAQIAERRADRERYIEAVTATLGKALADAGVAAQVSGRPKHIYSIWKKMTLKHVHFERIFDVRGVRVLVDELTQCYAALGVVHSLWSPIRGEFDDYIATPKKNDYRSIHTAVLGPEGRTIEVQIRTFEMHEHNELGVAAHWRYKEDAGWDDSLDRKIVWLRQLLEWKDEVSDVADLVDAFKSETFEERIYVFTPKGNVIDLPAGSTPLDFAYAIHTEVGHRCRGAKVNGRIVPLSRPLATGEQIEVLTVKKGGPSRDWLNPHLGYLRTSRARARVQRWFRAADFDQNCAAGRVALDRELGRLGIGEAKFEKLAAALGYRKVDEFLAAIGSGDLKVSQAVAPLREALEPRRSEDDLGRPAPPGLREKIAGGLRILGVGNLLTRMASCCSPLPGDAIVGYITQGRGVSIHRRDCGNILRLGDGAARRLVEVEWGTDDEAGYPVDIEVTAHDRRGLLHDITAVFSDARVNIAAVDMQTARAQNVARVSLTAEVSDIDELSGLLSRIARIPNVTDVRRVTH